MLTLTDTASTVVKSIAKQTPDADGLGLRITADSTDSNELNLSMASAPEPADDVIEADGARVFLEPTASTLLDDKVLDARVEDNGSVSFAIATQG